MGSILRDFNVVSVSFTAVVTAGEETELLVGMKNDGNLIDFGSVIGAF